jgi:outer membrane lipoprotein-sorting protein
VRKKVLILVATLMFGAMSFAQSAPAGETLESVLTQMDHAADKFKSAQADFEWDQYQKIVNDTDVQKGHVSFLHDKDTQMAAEITEPDHKFLVFVNGKLSFYQPKIEQVTEYDAGKNRAEVESFLVLGFGSRGHDLAKQFTVKYEGREVVDGVKTAKLELTPLTAKVRNMFSKIALWIDTDRDVSLKQQAFEPAGDYRLAKYSNIKLNPKLPDDTFKLKTTSKTKVVRPQ